MVDVYYDKDADLKHLEGKTIGMIGYGSQGHAQGSSSHFFGEQGERLKALAIGMGKADCADA